MFFSKDDAQRLFDCQVQLSTLTDMVETGERIQEHIKDSIHTTMKLISDQGTQIENLCEAINGLTGIILKIPALLNPQKPEKQPKTTTKKKTKTKNQDHAVD